MPSLKDISNIDFLSEFEFSTSRSSGAGGQNVNKVETKVSLRFSLKNTKLFNDDEKAFLKEKLNNQLIDEDIIQIVCQESRSQLKNKETAIKKFLSLLKKSFFVPIVRKPTPIPDAIIEKRLATKKRDSEIKANRSKIEW
jgi:ribosome-associated protein